MIFSSKAINVQPACTLQVLAKKRYAESLPNAFPAAQLSIILKITL